MGLGASNPRLDSTYGHVVDVPRAEGGGPVYRHKLGYAELVDRLESPDGYTAFTLYDVFQHGLQVNPSGPCLGTRALARNGAPGPYLWTSYQACWGRAQRFGAGLHAHLCLWWARNTHGYGATLEPSNRPAGDRCRGAGDGSDIRLKFTMKG